MGYYVNFVGVTGFEPATTWSQTRCATGLRYAPMLKRLWTHGGGDAGLFCGAKLGIIFGMCKWRVTKRPQNDG